MRRGELLPFATQADPIPAQAGVGLRFPHHGAVLSGEASAAWLEVHPENYLGDGATAAILEQVRRDHPLSLHATGLSLGSAEGIDLVHLDAIAALAGRIQPGLISDHLSWSVVDGVYLPDLLPVPRIREAEDVFVRNITRVQEVLQRPILIENPSVYFSFAQDDMSEGVFLANICHRSGCGVLLDVNNVAVSAANLGESGFTRLRTMLDALAPASIGEIHLAGHAVRTLEDGSCVHIDDHGAPVSTDVWALYEYVIARLGRRPTLIEWDTAIPAFAVLAAEAAQAEARMDAAQQVQHAAAG